METSPYPTHSGEHRWLVTDYREGRAQALAGRIEEGTRGNDYLMDTSITGITTESALQLFRRLAGASLDQWNFEPLDSSLPTGLAPGSVLELYGPASAGKTSWMMFMAACCVLPEKAGGKECGVVWIDADLRFDILRFVEIIEAHLVQAQLDVEENMKASLKRFHVYRVPRCVDMIATVLCLGDLLEEEGNLRCVFVDSISAFWWRNAAKGVGKEESMQHARFITSLREFVAKYKMVLVTSKAALFNKPLKEFAQLEHKEYMPSVWAHAVNVRVVLSPDLYHEKEQCFVARFEHLSKVWPFRIGPLGVVSR